MERTPSTMVLKAVNMRSTMNAGQSGLLRSQMARTASTSPGACAGFCTQSRSGPKHSNSHLGLTEKTEGVGMCLLWVSRVNRVNPRLPGVPHGRGGALHQLGGILRRPNTNTLVMERLFLLRAVRSDGRGQDLDDALQHVHRRSSRTQTNLAPETSVGLRC